MSAAVCYIDGRPFGKLAREFVCVVCARKVCGEHSSDYRINPFTGERGHACQRCLGETVEGTVEAQVAALFRQLQSFGTELKTLTAEVQALRQEVSSLPKSRPRTPRSTDQVRVPPTSFATPVKARKKKSPAPIA